MDKLKPVVAIKKFLETGPLGRPVPLKEMQAFLAACTVEEKQQFAQDSARALGVELDVV